jgi:hypothetical protein
LTREREQREREQSGQDKAAMSHRQLLLASAIGRGVILPGHTITHTNRNHSLGEDESPTKAAFVGCARFGSTVPEQETSPGEGRIYGG